MTMNRPILPSAIMTTRHLLALPLLLALTALPTASAHAGPTVSADLDLGTSTKSTPGEEVPPSPLYIAGFLVRAGWRFDVAPVWLLPEIGAGYAVERFATISGGPSLNANLARFFAGGRIGWSGPLQPDLHLEPSIYGHVGGGWYSGYYNQATGYACDVGLSLDLRIRRHFIVGAQVGYDVVTVPPVPAAPAPPLAGYIPMASPAVADPWVSYGIHAGWLFW
jgi:hypothetical protein